MLTQEQQDAVIRQARRMARTHLDTRRRFSKSEISARMAKQRIAQAEEDLRKLLREMNV